MKGSKRSRSSGACTDGRRDAVASFASMFEKNKVQDTDTLPDELVDLAAASPTAASSGVQRAEPSSIVPSPDAQPPSEGPATPLAGGMENLDDTFDEFIGKLDVDALGKKLRQLAEDARGEQPQPDDEEITMLKSEIDSGVNLRTSVGQSFGRDADGGQSNEYRLLRSHAEKKAFRIEWATKKLADTIEKKTKSTTLTKQDIEQGEYLPHDVIIDREGGAHRPAAVRAATNYIRKCIQMSGAWVHFNSFTLRYEFLFIRKQHIEVFEKSWSVFREQRTMTPASADQRAVNDQAGGSGEKATVANDDHKAKIGVSPRQPSSLEAAIGKARKTKQIFETVTTKAAALKAAIKNQEAWQWANDEKNQATLNKALKDIDDAMTPFITEMMTAEVKDLKQNYIAAVLENLCNDMVRKLEPLLKAVDCECKALVGMKQARQKFIATSDC